MPLKSKRKLSEKRTSSSCELRVVITSATAASIEHLMRDRKLQRASVIETAVAALVAEDARVASTLLLCAEALQKLKSVVSQIDVLAEFVVDVTAQADHDV